MAYCRNCGASAKDGTRFCPYCGQAIRNPVTYGNAAGTNPEYVNNSAGNRYYSRSTASAGTANVRRESRYYREDGLDVRDVEENHKLAVLCYFHVFLIIPLLLRPGSAYIRHHCNQGLLLTIFSLLVSAVSRMPLIGWIAGALGAVFIVICFVLGVLNAISGSARRLPIIGVFNIII